MKTKEHKAPEFKKTENVTLAQQIKVLDWYHANGQKQKKTAMHFKTIYLNVNITQPQVSDWLKEEVQWQEEYEKNPGSAAKMKCAWQTEHPEVTEMLEIWVKIALQKKVKLTGELIWQKWRVFVTATNVPKEDWLTLSNGWLAWFKNCLGLKAYKNHGEAGSADPEDVEREFKKIQQLVA